MPLLRGTMRHDIACTAAATEAEYEAKFEYTKDEGSLLLTWFNFNPNMDK